MTRTEIAKMVELMADEIGCDFAYHHFEEGQKPQLPFIAFQYPSTEDVYADNENYVGIENLNIYLCSDNVDFDSENVIKHILAENKITCVMHRDYIEKEHMYQTTFESEVLING